MGQTTVKVNLLQPHLDNWQLEVTYCFACLCSHKNLDFNDVLQDIIWK